MSDDPGGVFASEQHRRVLGHLSLPDEDFGYSPDELADRVSGDPNLGPIDVVEVLEDLEADGHVAHTQAHGWRQTKAGFKAITGPNKGAAA